MSKVLVPWGAGNAISNKDPREAGFEVLYWTKVGNRFAQTKNLELAVTLSVNQWNGKLPSS